MAEERRKGEDGGGGRKGWREEGVEGGGGRMGVEGGREGREEERKGQQGMEVAHCNTISVFNLQLPLTAAK